MKKENDLQLIKTGFLYFLYTQLIVLFSLIISLILIIPIRMIFSDSMTQNILQCILGLIAELFVTVIIFYSYQKNEKLSFLNVIAPCIIAYPLHFLLSLINGFYLYTAGSASTISDVVWSISTGTATYHKDVPIHCHILVFLTTLVLKFASLILSYLFVRIKFKKE